MSYLERVVSIEGRKICQCSTNGIGAFQGYTWWGMEQKEFIFYFPLFYQLNPYFCTKANDNPWFQFYFVSILIIEDENANLVIVIGFGAKIWIKLLEKDEIQNKFFFSIPNHVYLRKCQLHLLSIVKFRGFQCSRLFLGWD